MLATEGREDLGDEIAGGVRRRGLSVREGDGELSENVLAAGLRVKQLLQLGDSLEGFHLVLMGRERRIDGVQLPADLVVDLVDGGLGKHCNSFRRGLITRDEISANYSLIW